MRYICDCTGEEFSSLAALVKHVNSVHRLEVK